MKGLLILLSFTIVKQYFRNNFKRLLQENGLY